MDGIPFLLIQLFVRICVKRIGGAYDTFYFTLGNQCGSFICRDSYHPGDRAGGKCQLAIPGLAGAALRICKCPLSPAAENLDLPADRAHIGIVHPGD